MPSIWDLTYECRILQHFNRLVPRNYVFKGHLSGIRRPQDVFSIDFFHKMFFHNKPRRIPEPNNKPIKEQEKAGL